MIVGEEVALQFIPVGAGAMKTDARTFGLFESAYCVRFTQLRGADGI